MNMNKQVRLAVAGALLALGATAANAGISIPAGDWTVDISGNVNAFYIHNRSSDNNTVVGGLANNSRGISDISETMRESSTSSINTGLLPSWLTIGAKTRQNNLDVAWAISFQPGASSQNSLRGGGGSEYRQAYITFGDQSWGSIKIGKDLGVFGANAILNDMTLLGVGSQGLVGAAGGTTTTLGRIGTGFLYADFNGQINYTSPDWNGFQFTAGIAQPLSSLNRLSDASVGNDAGWYGAKSTVDNSPAFEGVASYSWAGDVAGKVWGEVKTQNVIYTANGTDDRATAWGIGANANFSGVGLTGYYYDATGVGTTAWLMDGAAVMRGMGAANAIGAATTVRQRDSNGYYLQATYAIPTVGTKLGVSWGRSKLDLASGEANPTLVRENSMMTVGAYHPLTKHLNLVAEYSRVDAENQRREENSSDIVSAGAILFF